MSDKQLDMKSIWDPNLRAAKKLRDRRRAQGFIERTHWIPKEFEYEFKALAEKARRECDREFK